MNQDYTSIEEWVGSTCRRNCEYARKAYESMSKNPENTRLYLANLIGSLETLAEFYVDSNATHPDQIAMKMSNKEGLGHKIKRGLLGGE